MDLPRPSIIAHRGASAYAPENTLSAFDLAVKQNAHAIELDAKLSSDGHVVVIHDQTVNRTTNGSGRVSDLPLLELKELDAGCNFDVSFCGERIPTLDEVFSNFGDKIYINVELTNYKDPFNDLAYRVIKLIRKYRLSQRVLLSSFNPLALIQFHHHIPDVPIGLLAYPGMSKLWLTWPFNKVIYINSFHAPEQDVTPVIVDRTHRKGKKLYVYTVNQSDSMIKLFSWGVDGIFTDDPPSAFKTLSGMGNKLETPID